MINVLREYYYLHFSFKYFVQQALELLLAPSHPPTPLTTPTSPGLTNNYLKTWHISQSIVLSDSFKALQMHHLCLPNMHAKLQFIKYILIEDLIYAMQVFSHWICDFMYKNSGGKLIGSLPIHTSRNNSKSFLNYLLKMYLSMTVPT